MSHFTIDWLHCFPPHDANTCASLLERYFAHLSIDKHSSNSTEAWKNTDTHKKIIWNQVKKQQKESRGTERRTHCMIKYAPLDSYCSLIKPLCSAPHPRSMNERCEGSKKKRNNERTTEENWYWCWWNINLKLIIVLFQQLILHLSGHLLHYLWKKKKKTSKSMCFNGTYHQLWCLHEKPSFFLPDQKRVRSFPPSSSSAETAAHWDSSHEQVQHTPVSRQSLLFCHLCRTLFQLLKVRLRLRVVVVLFICTD